MAIQVALVGRVLLICVSKKFISKGAGFVYSVNGSLRSSGGCSGAYQS